jgi:hypothetical protein
MTDIEHAVDIVNISMLPSTIMNIVFGHRYFGTVENSGLNSKSGRISGKKKSRLFFYLIHIVPDVNVIRALGPSPLSLDFLSFKHNFPPVPSTRIEKVCPGAATTPTPTFVFTFTAFRFYKEL